MFWGRINFYMGVSVIISLEICLFGDMLYTRRTAPLFDASTRVKEKR